MDVNATIGNVVIVNGGNSTSSSTGQAVGLTVFFMILMVPAVVIAYKYRSKIRSILQHGQTRNQEKENYAETPESDSNQYTSMIPEKSEAQAPIYENLTTRQTGFNKLAEKHSKLPAEPEEDLYLQCDSQGDAIYSNDQKCSLAIFQEEDVYIIPES